MQSTEDILFKLMFNNDMNVNDMNVESKRKVEMIHIIFHIITHLFKQPLIRIGVKLNKSFLA